MVTKKMSRFFGLLPERSHPESPAPEHSIAGHPAFEAIPTAAEPRIATPTATQLPPGAEDDSVGPLLRALDLSSHADDRRLTAQEKRRAWELPPRVTQADPAAVSRSTSKARLMLPALEQMRATQAALMAAQTSGGEPGIDSTEASRRAPATARSQAASPTTHQAAAARPQRPAAAEAAQVKPLLKRTQPTPPASAGWEYTMVLQRTQDSPPPSTPEAASEPAAERDESDLTQMFGRLRAHSATPPTPPLAVAKATGFLHNLWAK